jgi:hypothetical protein
MGLGLMTLQSVCRIATVAALTVLGTTARAQAGTESVSFAASAINLVAFVGAPSLTINTAVAGAAPTSVTNGTASWAVTTNQSFAKITARIPANMPAGLTLSVNLVAPAGAVSAGYKALSTVSVDVVTGVTKVAQAGMLVTYRLDATAAAGVVAAANRVVTYTITGGV